MDIFEYYAQLGLGVGFPCKTFIFDDENRKIIVSPGPFDQATLEKLKASDKELHFVSPNSFHHLYLAYCKDEFPEASFYGEARAEKQSGLTLKKLTELPLSSNIKRIELGGMPGVRESCFYLAEEKTVILTDLVFNLSKDKVSFMTSLAMRVFGTYNRLAVSRLMKIAIRDMDPFKKSLRQLLSCNFRWAYINHGEKVSKKDLTKFLTETFDL